MVNGIVLIFHYYGGRKNAGFIHVTTRINIQTIFSEKKSTEKRPPRTLIHHVCFQSIKFVQITENLSNTLNKEKRMKMETKDIFIHLNIAKWKWGGGLHYNVDTI